MSPIELANLLKDVSKINAFSNDPDFDKRLSKLKNYLSSIHTTEELRQAIRDICDAKAEIIAETQHFVNTLCFMLEYMVTFTPDLMFSVDRMNGQTKIEIIQEASRGYLTEIQSEKLIDAVKDIPQSTITIGCHTAVILLTRMGYLPSPIADRKTSLIMEFIKYRDFDRRLKRVEDGLETLQKNFHIHIKDSGVASNR